MFIKSLQWRLVSIFISISIVLMVLVWVISSRGIVYSYYEIFRQGIEAGFKSLPPDIEKAGDNEIDIIKKHISSFYIIGEYRSYTIIDKRNTEIIESSARKYSNDPVSFTSEILKSKNLLTALKGETGDRPELTYTNSSAFFDYAQPLGEKSNYILYFRYDREEWEKAIGNFNTIILVSCLIAVSASLVIGYFLSKTITGPIIRLMHKARRIAAGDFDQVMEVKSRDEIGKLTNAFNFMAKELKKNINEVSSEKNKVETILNYMTDGVVAFNLKGEIIHANPAAAKILETGEIHESFNEFSNKYRLGLSLEDIQYLGDASSKEFNIHVNDKFIRMYFAVFTDENKKAEGIIGVLQDVTEQQKLENMRREFVANVSHELRTPLTSIKSYAETLLDGALEDRETAERFLNVINSEADRMTRLVKDLLQLSRLDNSQMQWKMQNISFTEVVKGVVDKLQLEAKNKSQQMESFIIGEIPQIRADRDRIEQVVVNLVSNAIKYTPEGGKITVYIGKMYSEVYMKVVDTGIGIPEADLPRVFERFYRVDKARSREMGGTGLGLAIAKEIVEAHGGNISAASEAGKGTEFTVKLPIADAGNNDEGTAMDAFS